MLKKKNPKTTSFDSWAYWHFHCSGWAFSGSWHAYWDKTRDGRASGHSGMKGCCRERDRWGRTGRGRIMEDSSASLVFNFRSDQGPVLQKVIFKTLLYMPVCVRVCICMHVCTHCSWNTATGKWLTHLKSCSLLRSLNPLMEIWHLKIDNDLFIFL